MKTNATPKSDLPTEIVNQAVCFRRFLTKGFVLAIAMLFSSTFLLAQTNSNSDGPTIIVKKELYPGDGVVPMEVQSLIDQYSTQQSVGILGDDEPGGTPPTIEVCPEDQTVECFGDVGHTASELEYTINCGPNGIIIIYEPPGILETGSCPGTEYPITYDVWDQCGNNVTCEQIFTIDNPAPEITFCPEGGIIESADQAVSNVDALQFTFSCPEDPLCSDITVEVDYYETFDPCMGDMFVYVYTITDACGRSDECEQIFHIPPPPIEIICPEGDDVVVECASDIMPNMDDVTVINAVGEFTVTASEPTLMSGDADCPGAMYQVMYTVVDECQNTASCSTSFVIDNEGPTITAPDAVTLECAADAAADIDGVSFMTSCELDAEVTAEGPNLLEGDGFCDGSIWEFVYTVTDDCGRTASATQMVTISNEGPTITAPDAVTIECAADAAADIDGVSFMTSCELGAEVTAEGPNLLEGDGFCDGSIWEFVYTVTDDCGRTASATQMVTISNEGPTITAPDAVTIECAADAAADIDGVSFTTSCDFEGVVTAEGPNLLEGDGFCDGSIWEFVYTVTDDCGRTASAAQMVTISNEGPTITAPDAVTIECAADAAADIDGVSFTTSCDFEGVVTAEGPNLLEGDGFCDGSIWEFVYTVTDDCGRTASAAQMVTISNEGPTITAPDAVTIECAADAAADIDGVSYTTSCDFEGVVTAEGPNLLEGDGFCDGSIWEFVYTVTDDCGRTASAAQTVTISNEGPTITAPDAVTVECAADAAADIDGVSFMTSCELGAEVTAEGPNLLEGDGFCDGSIWEFVYTVTDDCGRTASATQMVTISNEGPSITAPEDVEVACIDDFIADVDAALVGVACDLQADVEAGDLILLEGEGSCDLTQYMVTYTVTDQCGRSSSDDQMITIVNGGLEVLATPENQTVTCYDDISPDPWGIEYFSPCSSDVFIQVTPPTQLCCEEDCPGAEYSIIYTISNDCGDEEVIEQIFTIDNEGPTIISCGEDMEVESFEDIVVSIDDVEYETACGVECEVTVVSEPEVVDNECEGTDYIYTFSVTDNCGRTATCERTFTVPNTDPACQDDNNCPGFTTFYANHGSGIDGTNIYTVTFSGTDAILEFEVNVDFQVHMAFDAVNSLLYMVDADGGFVRIYDPATDTFLGDLLIDGDIDELFAVEYNPNDGLLYVGDASDDEIYTIDLSGATGVPIFFADAPVNGGDLAFRDGDLYLADRTNSELFIVTADGDGIADGTDDVTFVGDILPEVNGMTQVNNVSDLIVSNGNSSTFAKISSADGSTLVTYSATLGGESFELLNGDMASGCANNFGISPCEYALYYTHNPSGTSDYSLLEVELDPLGNATYTTLLENLGSSHIGLSNDGSEIYMVGGSNVRTYDVESGTITNDVSVFNGATGANLSSFPAAVVGPDGNFYIGGAGNNVWLCDPATGEATNIASGINVNGGDLIWAPTGEDETLELWIITRNNATFTRVLDPGNGSFSVDVEEINGATVLENGNVLVADGDGNTLLKEVSLSSGEVVATYDIDLPLNNGDLAGGCTGEIGQQAIAVVDQAQVLTLPTQIYPNPAVDAAVITFEPAENVMTTVDLYDMSGRPLQSLFNANVKAGLEYRINVNTQSFENGMYIYKIKNGSHHVTKKLMIVD